MPMVQYEVLLHAMRALKWLHLLARTFEIWHANLDIQFVFDACVMSTASCVTPFKL